MSQDINFDTNIEGCDACDAWDAEVVLFRKHSSTMPGPAHNGKSPLHSTRQHSPALSSSGHRRRSISQPNLVQFMTLSDSPHTPNGFVDSAPNSYLQPAMGDGGSGSFRDLRPSPSFREDDLKVFSPDEIEVGPLIGKGFFGDVYLVMEKATKKLMVLKKLKKMDSDTKSGARFLKEVSVMRQCHHPNVLRYIGRVYENKQIHLLTEYIDGGSLKDLIQNKDRPFSWTDRVAVGRDIACGMSYLHKLSVIHRDLNSGNILIRFTRDFVDGFIRPDCDGVQIEAVVGDFGLVRLTSNQRSRKDRREPRRYTVVGSPYWMAPEMLREGKYDHRVDIFSFGITLCEIIGRISADPDVMPRRKADYGLDEQAFLSTFVKPECPPPLVAIAFRSAQVNPDQRPPFSVLYEWLNAAVIVQHQRQSGKSSSGLDYTSILANVHNWQPGNSPSTSVTDFMSDVAVSSSGTSSLGNGDCLSINGPSFFISMNGT